MLPPGITDLFLTVIMSQARCSKDTLRLVILKSGPGPTPDFSSFLLNLNLELDEN